MPQLPRTLGAYEVEGLVGAGGMAEVHAAHDGHRRVALKVLTHRSATLGERLAREARVQALVEHPNVLPLLATASHDGFPVLVLPLVDGPTLQALLRAGALAPQDGLALFRGIVSGVAALHAAGIVHRDLKPGNVLLDPVGDTVVPRVSDFGLAKAQADEGAFTRTGAALGTPGYAAPEQLADPRKVDARADVWALGCLLYELLAGEPYASSTRARLVARPPWPALAASMLDPDPARRPADANAVEVALGETGPLSAALVARCRAMAPRGVRTGAGAPSTVDGLVSSLAEGGRVLLTRRPSGPHVSHGHWQRGEEAPVELFEPRVPGTLPPLPPAEHGDTRRVVLRDGAFVPVGGLEHGLPGERDPFVGRGTELRTVAARFDEGARLVCLVGTGGAGKTRAALRFARAWLPAWPGGCWFVDLADARSADGVVLASARALEVPLGRAEAAVQVGHALASLGRALLILDNVEQVSVDAAGLVARWLELAPEVRFLATTRVALRVPGEAVVAVDSLGDDEAVSLFRVRAGAAAGGAFSADPTAVLELVSLLDGLPLAIELAAARVRVMPVGRIAALMRERFRVLAAPGGGRPERQATLRAALDWSWSLLDPWARAALAQLSVFEGGVSSTLASRVVVLSGGAPPVASVLDDLVAHSLLRQPAPERYELLVSVQEYAAEALRASGQDESVRVRHGAALAEVWNLEALVAVDRASAAVRQSLHAELGNLMEACRRALARGDTRVAATTGFGAWRVLELRGPFEPAVALLDAVAAMDLPDALRPRIQQAAGAARVAAGRQDEGLAWLVDALAGARAQGDAVLEATVLSWSGAAHRERARLPASAACYEEMRAVARRIGDARLEGVALCRVGVLHQEQGRPTEAMANYEASLALVRAAGDTRYEGVVVCAIGVVHNQLGRPSEATACFEEAVRLHRASGDRRNECLALTNLGASHRLVGRPEAEAVLTEALAVARRTGDRRMEAMVEDNFGGLFDGRGEHARAIERRAVALECYRSVGDPRGEAICLANQSYSYSASGRNGEARAALALALPLFHAVGDASNEGLFTANLGSILLEEGDVAGARRHYADGERLLRGCDDKNQLGKVLCGRVELELRAGHPEAAAAALAEAEAIAAESGVGAASELGRRVRWAQEQWARAVP